MRKAKFGGAFLDELKKYSFKTRHHTVKSQNHFDLTETFFESDSSDHYQTHLLSPWRRLVLIILPLIAFSALFFRLFHLQVTEGKENLELADSNRIQVQVIHAPRGVIYDRNGAILAQNEPGFRLTESSGSAKVIRYLERDEALEMELKGASAGGSLEIDSNRSYPHGDKFTHVLGYVGEITEEELKDPKFINYKLGDKIGRGGVEEAYEKVLKGIDGGEIVEVDAQGKKIRSLRRTEAIPGQNLFLTIDADLQTRTFEVLTETLKKSESCCGAVIAQDPRNGEILSMVSLPSYDPKKLTEALVNPNSPMLNRVIGGTYPPGSTFKIASGLAGLHSGKITGSTQFEDTGVMALGPFTFANWYFTQYGRKEEGGVDIVRALKRSNDIYFYRLGQEIGEQVIAETSRKLNLGKKVGIDIPGEVEGLVADDAWKRQNMDEVWYPGDTLHMSIGQGYLLSTPLQINNLVSFVASDGKMFPPHLAYRITSPRGQLIRNFKFDPVLNKEFKSSDVALIRKGLEEVPKDGGTAWPFFTFPIQTAGKTGTAEFGHPKNETHAWYTGYAPVNDPVISVTVLVEAGGEGSSVASPVVKEIFRWYLSEDKKNLLQDLKPVSATDSARTLGE